MPVLLAESARKPLLGICLGMQLLFDRSFEYGEHAGLGLVPGEVADLRGDLTDPALKVPHMGWNSLHIVKDDPLFRYFRDGEYVYYVHSFYARNCVDSTLGTSQYGNVAVTGAGAAGQCLGDSVPPGKVRRCGAAAAAGLCGALRKENPMQIFPAIDLSGGQVVRLYQGDYDQMTVYGQDPCAVARDFLAAGATYLHVVDLDGAKDGTLANFDSIAAIARQGGLYIEVGGGIRTEERIRQYLDLGVSRCILGTVAVKDFAFTERMAQKYGDRSPLAWTRGTAMWPSTAGRSCPMKRAWTSAAGLYKAGVGTVIYTDISRDGAERGTNLALYRELSAIDGLNVTASGGVSSLDELRELQRIGTSAAILGKALYTGRLDLKTVIEEVGSC